MKRITFYTTRNSAINTIDYALNHPINLETSRINIKQNPPTIVIPGPQSDTTDGRRLIDCELLQSEL